MPKLFGNQLLKNKLSLKSKLLGLPQFSKLLGLLWFWREEQNSEFPNFFSGDIFLYLLNIFAPAVPKLKQKISKIIVQF